MRVSTDIWVSQRAQRNQGGRTPANIVEGSLLCHTGSYNYNIYFIYFIIYIIIYVIYNIMIITIRRFSYPLKHNVVDSRERGRTVVRCCKHNSSACKLTPGLIIITHQDCFPENSLRLTRSQSTTKCVLIWYLMVWRF